MRNYLYGGGCLAVFGVSAAIVWLARPLLKDGFVWADLVDDTWQDDLDEHEDEIPVWLTPDEVAEAYPRLDMRYAKAVKDYFDKFDDAAAKYETMQTEDHTYMDWGTQKW